MTERSEVHVTVRSPRGGERVTGAPVADDGPTVCPDRMVHQ
jgi:hypothetical protein